MENLPVPEHPDPYQVTSSELLFDSPWIRLREDKYVHRNGHRGNYAICGFRQTACGVLALDEHDRVVLVGQWRHPLKRYSWEIVEGGGGENETPFQAIQRELAEEAGLQASYWEPLLYSNLSNSSTDEEAFLFIARDLYPVSGGQHPDVEEELTVIREPFSKCLQHVFSGLITDGLSVIALLAEQGRRTGTAQRMEPGLQERFFQTPKDHPSDGRTQWDFMATNK
ncbi:MAG: NUDIX hydrolase [Holophagaceae bacterium]|nr:NUDIX hydrolase [Holophagaceae bacterium]